MPRLLVVPAGIAGGAIVHEWVDPNGVAHALSGNGNINVEVGGRGLGFTAVALVDDKLPFSPGTVARHAAVQPRTIELPLLLEAATPATLQALIDTVYGWFATADEQALQPGALRITRPDGAQRQIACYYVGGLEGDLAAEHAGDTWQSVVVELKAPDPAATDIAYSSATLTVADLPTISINNTGSLEAYPVWTFSGGFTSIRAENTTTGEAFEITLSLATELVVDTRPAAIRPTKSVYSSADGISRFPNMSADSALWRLQPGTNDLSITIGGGYSTSQVVVAWLPRYRGLLR